MAQNAYIHFLGVQPLSMKAAIIRQVSTVKFGGRIRDPDIQLMKAYPTFNSSISWVPCFGIMSVRVNWRYKNDYDKNKKEENVYH